MRATEAVEALRRLNLLHRQGRVGASFRDGLSAARAIVADVFGLPLGADAVLAGPGEPVDLLALELRAADGVRALARVEELEQLLADERRAAGTRVDRLIHGDVPGGRPRTDDGASQEIKRLRKKLYAVERRLRESLPDPEPVAARMSGEVVARVTDALVEELRIELAAPFNPAKAVRCGSEPEQQKEIA